METSGGETGLAAVGIIALEVCAAHWGEPYIARIAQSDAAAILTELLQQRDFMAKKPPVQLDLSTI
jgi:hypothetical protein